MASYKVLKGIDYPPNKRAEVGDVVTDLAPTSIAWLIEVNAIEDTNRTVRISEPVVVETELSQTVNEESE